MKIAIILQQKFDPNAGGVQRVTNNLSQLLSVQNEVYIICFNKNEKNRYVDNIPIVAVKSDIELKNILDQLNIEVIINQTGYSVKFTKMLLYITNNKAKIINNLHINPLNFYDNHKNIIQELFNRKKIGFLNTYFTRKIILGYHVWKQRKELGFIVKNTDAFVMLSEKFKPELLFLVPKLKKYLHKIHGIGNPFQRPEVDIKALSKENIVLFVGRLDLSQKRVDLLLKIWKKLHVQAPDWKFWVLGDGAEKKNMEKYCLQNKLDRVQFFGKVDPTEYYKKAKIFHMTSAFEGFGNVLIEAQSYGCVPMLFDSYAAASDIVHHNQNGILIKAFDCNEYAAETKKLMDNPEKTSELALNAYENVLRFSYEETYKKWEKVFEFLRKKY
ncbi:glycosyltransferase [Cloacibacterium sp.]|uniref:glycosyltransferase n=1 Tax=Cloacibacterium sp. TaxID=1913682 RepID=UPI0035AFB683